MKAPSVKHLIEVKQINTMVSLVLYQNGQVSMDYQQHQVANAYILSVHLHNV